LVMPKRKNLSRFTVSITGILKDVSESQPTTITDIAKRLSVSESTISRQVARLAKLGAMHLLQKGKTKEVRITLTGKILL